MEPCGGGALSPDRAGFVELWIQGKPRDVIAMNANSRFLRASFASTGGSLLLALSSVLLGRMVYYLDHLLVFNVMAALMLLLAIVGLGAGVAAAWHARGRGALGWVASLTALALIGVYLADR
jgi:hypothetical protein